ncbi:MAG TPA: uroporphyrinogen-III C-methyltransferase [Holophagaceae bacterium]|nr:uroporphyrinogen-III C-methyltransferase [Holophagaceae bacterium]
MTDPSDPRTTRTGFVSLVGAGPGSPELITVRGLRALQAADVVLYDALLEPGFLDLFPSHAEEIPVGKRCGAQGTAQEEIHRLLLLHAHRGKRVARLKGGDPFVFGRGGEEAQALEAEGIPFEVIPGVSALQGAAAAAGIPLTHRGLAREIRVLEGHHLLDPGTDWGGLARTQATLALFMGTRSLKAIARQLLQHGAPEDLPLALVERAFCEGQRTTVSTIRLAADGHLCPRTEGPGLLFLGAVVGARVHPRLPESDPVHGRYPAPPLPRPPAQLRAAGGRRERRAG